MKASTDNREVRLTYIFHLINFLNSPCCLRKITRGETLCGANCFTAYDIGFHIVCKLQALN